MPLSRLKIVTPMRQSRVFVLFLLIFWSFAFCVAAQGVEEPWRVLEQRLDSITLDTLRIVDHQDFPLSVHSSFPADATMIFVAGITYQLIAAADVSLSCLRIELFDMDRNKLFDSQKYGSVPLWSFRFSATAMCRVQVFRICEDHEGTPSFAHVLLRQGISNYQTPK